MEEGKWIVGKTTAGKTLQIVRNPASNLYSLQYSTGGEIPVKLRGDWNNVEMLMSGAKVYLEGINSKVEEAEEELEDAKSDSDKTV